MGPTQPESNSGKPQRTILVGPGGVGKTTLGRAIAAHTGQPFFDLDEMFCDTFLNIADYIRLKGYQNYARTNFLLLKRFLAQPPQEMVLALSSGVLSHDMPETLRGQLVPLVRNTGRAMHILPLSDDVLSAQIVANRQVKRGFGLRYEPERQKYIRRVDQYRELGFEEAVLNTADRQGAFDAMLKKLM